MRYALRNTCHQTGATLALLLFAAFSCLASDSSPSAKPARTILVLGDSIAAGFGLDGNDAFPALLQKKMDQAGWNFEVVNAGVSGDTSAGGLRRIDWVLKRKCDVLILELGGNDGLRGLPVDAMQQNLQATIDRTRAKYPQVEILIAGMQMPPNLGAEYARDFQQAFVRLAQKNKATLIPFLLEGVGGRPELNLPDRIHPTVEGHKIVAENVWKYLRPVLQKLQP
ncbi:MAG TPA: arylesterase [Verrucomicrobiae bacterium]|nr:arylesterase [Verrucomicrobiae bacterium]